MKRLFWFTVGVGVGVAGSLWALHTARAKVRQLRPESVAGQVTAGAKSFAGDLRAAALEGRSAMREREAALRAELDAARAEPTATTRALRASVENPSLN